MFVQVPLRLLWCQQSTSTRFKISFISFWAGSVAVPLGTYLRIGTHACQLSRYLYRELIPSYNPRLTTAAVMFHPSGGICCQSSSQPATSSLCTVQHFNLCINIQTEQHTISIRSVIRCCHYYSPSSLMRFRSFLQTNALMTRTNFNLLLLTTLMATAAIHLAIVRCLKHMVRL